MRPRDFSTIGRHSPRKLARYFVPPFVYGHVFRSVRHRLSVIDLRTRIGQSNLPVEVTRVEVERGFDVVPRRNMHAADGRGMLKVPSDTVGFVHRDL